MTARALSRAYSVAMYRATRTTPAHYRPLAGGRDDCDECYARQHETRGRAVDGGGTRAAARVRRSFDADESRTGLLLCREHAALWQERDTADGVPQRGAR